jgi:hypothetical protein
MNVSNKNVKYNVLMALAILFAIFYQSLHIFTDESHQHHSHEIVHKNTSKTEFTQDNHEDCPVCDFEFAAFLAKDVFVVHLFSPQPKFHFSNTYESIVKEKEFLCFSHRGPPVV